MSYILTSHGRSFSQNPRRNYLQVGCHCHVVSCALLDEMVLIVSYHDTVILDLSSLWHQQWSAVFHPLVEHRFCHAHVCRDVDNVPHAHE